MASINTVTDYTPGNIEMNILFYLFINHDVLVIDLVLKQAAVSRSRHLEYIDINL